MDDKTPRLSKKYNLLGHVSSIGVAGGTAAFGSAVFLTLKSVIDNLPTPKKEVFLLALLGGAMVTGGVVGMNKVFREEERIGVYSRQLKP